MCLQILTWDLRGGRAAAVSFGAGGPSGDALLQRLPLRPLLASLPSLAEQVPRACFGCLRAVIACKCIMPFAPCSNVATVHYTTLDLKTDATADLAGKLACAAPVAGSC